MSIAASLLPEFDQEMQNSRKTLERMPDDKSKFGWTPHPKSMPFLKLANHLTTVVDWAVHTIEKDSVDVASAPTPTLPASKQELLETFDKNVHAAHAALAGASDERLLQPWSLKHGEKIIFTMPRTQVLRTLVMNHIIHHRAQLCVYLRLNDIPVPAIYGPSADEQGF